jgi:hypothetical protein
MGGVRSPLGLKSEFKRQMANGKIQMACNLPMFQILNHLPFDLCPLPFELFIRLL